MFKSQHGNCPNCGVSFDGGSIYLHFLNEYNGDETKALKTAEMYGADATQGQWGRQIGLSNGDSVFAWTCPDCDHERSR